jgi:thiol-disulfide isomerase/thioredoxin
MAKKYGIAAAVAAVLVVISAVLYLRWGGPAAGPPITGWMQNFTPAPAAGPAPRFPFFAPGDKRLTLADFRGRVVLINFWATWCAPCVREMPSLRRLHTRLAGPDFTVLALSQDREGWSIIEPFAHRLKLGSLPLVLDRGGDFARGIGVHGLPTSVLFDRSGNELGRLVGVAEWDSAEAVALLTYYIGAGRNK